MFSRWPARVNLVAAMLLCAACGSGGGSEVASNRDLQTESLDNSDELFDPERLLQIDIDIPPENYETLRYEGRNLNQVFSGCFADYEYTHFEATVTVDGKAYDRVDIRKKGFFGSLSAARPSFKLDFGELRQGREIYSMRKLTLNNNRQDPGNSHQCLAYGLFRNAGLAASRCNYARVSLNGEDLGIYTNVESIEKRFLSRNFGRDGGNLYESQAGGDFGEFLKEYFQAKTNQETNDRSDLDRVVAALRADDDNMPALVDQWVDLDEFLTYWAMEGIAGHWDSATGNANNHFLYNDPTDNRFRYIPWGTDGAFELSNPLAPGTGPLYRYITIPARLHNIPQWQAAYNERVLHLLDTVWDSEALMAEIDRIRDLTGTPEEDLAQVRNFVEEHPQRVRDSVAGDLVQRERTIVDQPRVCVEPQISRMQGLFSDGFGSFNYIDEEGNTVTVIGAVSSPDSEGPLPLGQGISFTIVGESEQGLRLLVIFVETGEFGPGDIPLHGLATTMFLVGETEDGLGFVGAAGVGTLTLEAPVTVGQPLTGSLDVDLALGALIPLGAN